MKKNIVTLIALSAMAAMLLFACGTEIAAPEDATAEISKSEDAIAEVTGEENSAGDAEDSSKTSDSTGDFSSASTSGAAGVDSSFDQTKYTSDKPILVVDHTLVCPIDGNVGAYSEIILNDEEKAKYPEFAKYVEGFNAKYKEYVLEDLRDHGKTAEDGKTCVAQYNMRYLTVKFTRIDEHLATLVADEYVEGGPHPNYGSMTFNVDLDTGKELEFSQILNDDSRLVEAVKHHTDDEIPEIYEYLTDKYNNGTKEVYFDEFLTATYTEVMQKGYFDYELTEEGLHITFDEYDIAPHGFAAFGDITLKYSDYPELVKEEYVVKKTEAPDNLVDYKEVKETIEAE